MKKIIFGLTVLISFISCNKEEIATENNSAFEAQEKILTNIQIIEGSNQVVDLINIINNKREIKISNNALLKNKMIACISTNLSIIGSKREVINLSDLLNEGSKLELIGMLEIDNIELNSKTYEELFPNQFDSQLLMNSEITKIGVVSVGETSWIALAKEIDYLSMQNL